MSSSTPSSSAPLPKERAKSLRHQLLDFLFLREGCQTAQDLSRLVGIREKDVAAHLDHLVKSLRHTDMQLVVEPAHCRSCGFVFKQRKRYTRPSGCPRCRKQNIDPPVFRVTSDSF